MASAASAKDLLGASPGFYGTMKQLRFGMSRTEAAKAAPILFAERRQSYDPVLYGFSFHPRRGLDALYVHFMVPQKGVSRGLNSAWGPSRRCTPLAGRGGAAPSKKTPVAQAREVWTSSDQRLVVSLRPNAKGRAETLAFEPAQTLTEIWGAGLVGMPVADAAKRLGAPASKGKGWAKADLRLPGPPMSDRVEVRWTERGGLIKAVELVVDARSCREARVELEKKIRRFSRSLKGRVRMDQPAVNRWRIRIDTVDRL